MHVSFTSSSSAAEAPTCVCVCCVGGGRDIAGEEANVEKATLAASAAVSVVSAAVAAVSAAVAAVVAAVAAVIAAVAAVIAAVAAVAAVIAAVIAVVAVVAASATTDTAATSASLFVGVDSGELKTNGSCTVTMAEGVDSEKEEFGKTESAALPPGQPKGELSNITPAWVGVPKDAPNAPNACTSVESDCDFGSATSSIFVGIVVVVSKSPWDVGEELYDSNWNSEGNADFL